MAAENVEILDQVKFYFPLAEDFMTETSLDPYVPRCLWYKAHEWYDLGILGFNDAHEMIGIDDPFNDDGFSYFLRKERIFEQSLDVFTIANIVCATKLNYLMIVKVISSMNEIPLFSQNQSSTII